MFEHILFLIFYSADFIFGHLTFYSYTELTDLIDNIFWSLVHLDKYFSMTMIRLAEIYRRNSTDQQSIILTYIFFSFVSFRTYLSSR